MITLKTFDFFQSGIFGELQNDDGSIICYTLEHAYPDPNSSNYLPKVPAGVFTCKRGMHILEGMSAPFETFEITGVPGHTNILFHTGNVNADSAGCVLLGQQRNNMEILGSRLAFAAFMDKTKYLDTFDLKVIR